MIPTQFVLKLVLHVILQNHYGREDKQRPLVSRFPYIINEGMEQHTTLYLFVWYIVPQRTKPMSPESAQTLCMLYYAHHNAYAREV